jgi:hypothetical protein
MDNSLIYQQAMTSPTAGRGQGLRTDHIYSAIVVGNGGQATVNLFIGPQNSPIPASRTSTGVVPGHQATYTDLTTNLLQSGQTGGTIGDAFIHAFGVTVEQAPYNNAGVLQAYGAGPLEFGEILAKIALEIQIVNIEQIKGPLWAFPGLGGVVGSIAMAITGATASSLVTFLTNGVPGSGRVLAAPLPLARIDTMRGIVSIPGANDPLSFSVTAAASAGQSTLLWCAALATLTTDVRA